VENAEFYDHIVYPEFEMPDLIIMPSVWKLDEIRNHAESRGTKVVQIHHPVDRDEIRYVPRTGKQFMHVAGTPASFDRNGTWEFLQACPNGIVAVQNDELARHIAMRYSQAQIYPNMPDPNIMLQTGDILVLPRKYGGNCLVLNEALASGMPVIMTDISPNNHLLPPEWLVPAHVTGTFTPRTEVQVHTVDVPALFAKLEWMRDQDIVQMSKQASDIADTISWTALKQTYINALESIL
jgi:glycosyltransferase involved in cell wall biosynthesis